MASFGPLLVGELGEVVGAAGSVVGDLSDGGDVQGVFELAVVSLVEPVPGDRSAGGFDRGGAVDPDREHRSS
jgi:hypothetical protein